MTQETKWTPGPWLVLEVTGKSFVAAKPTQDHPYFRRTRYMDICGDEDYPRKAADLTLCASAPTLYEALRDCLAAMELMHEYMSCAPLIGGAYHSRRRDAAKQSHDAAKVAAKRALAQARGEGE